MDNWCIENQYRIRHCVYKSKSHKVFINQISVLINQLINRKKSQPYLNGSQEFNNSKSFVQVVFYCGIQWQCVIMIIFKGAVNKQQFTEQLSNSMSYFRNKYNTIKWSSTAIYHYQVL